MTGPDIVDRHLPDGLLGRYLPDQNRIEIDPRQTAAQYKCTLAHEWLHYLRGDHSVTCAVLDAKREASVDRVVARQLIPFHALKRLILIYGFDHEQIADELGVDEATVECRLRTLHNVERGRLALALSEREHVA